MKNNLCTKGFMVPVLLGIIVVLIIGGGLYFYKTKKADAPVVVNDKQVDEGKTVEEVKKEIKNLPTNIYKETDLKKFATEKYSFYAPSEWKENITVLTEPGKFTDCDYYSISYGGDGHTMGGSIGINTSYCFGINSTGSGPIKEKIEKDGYFIFAMYDKDSGTTPTEELKTKEVYKKVVETFTLNKETMSIKLYLGNQIFNPGSFDCSLVYPIDRIIPYTQAVASATLNELIKGPTLEEQKLGYFRSIPDGTKVNSIKIVNGVLFIDFNKNIENNFTSCSGAARMSSIISTLKQFPTVKDIKFSVEGNSNPDQILQP